MCLTNVMVVEDEPSIRCALTAQLRSIPGVRIVEMRNVERAKRWIEEAEREGQSLALGVIDLRLPWSGQIHIDGGFEVMRAVRASFPDSHLLVVTVRGDEVARSRAETEYRCKFLAKPWRRKELVAIAEQMLGRSQPMSDERCIGSGGAL